MWTGVGGVLWAIVLYVCPLASSIGQGPAQEAEVLPLRIAAEVGLSDFWQVTRAEVSERTFGVSERLQVRNASDGDVAGARFYAEYYDAKNRRCLTAVFDLSENLQGQRGEMRSGETRVLFADTGGLFPGSAPEGVSIRQVAEGSVLRPSGERPTFDGYLPVTVAATSRHATDTWQRLCLEQEGIVGSQPLVDLLLAEVDVDATGQVEATRVVEARSPQILSWFSEFAPHLRFRPASGGGSRESARTLLLLRAMTASMHPGALVPPPRTSMWLRKFVADARGSDVPWVNVLILEPPPPETTSSGDARNPAMPLAPPTCVEYNGIGTEWSINIRVPH